MFRLTISLSEQLGLTENYVEQKKIMARIISEEKLSFKEDAVDSLLMEAFSIRELIKQTTSAILSFKNAVINKVKSFFSPTGVTPEAKVTIEEMKTKLSSFKKQAEDILKVNNLSLPSAREQMEFLGVISARVNPVYSAAINNEVLLQTKYDVKESLDHLDDGQWSLIPFFIKWNVLYALYNWIIFGSAFVALSGVHWAFLVIFVYDLADNIASKQLTV